MKQKFKWSDEKTTELINLHEAGLDRHEIARALAVLPVRVQRRMAYLGLTPTKKTEPSDIDLGQKMHELARLRFSIDECAYALQIDLPKAFELAQWYGVKFDEVPVDLETARYWLSKNRSHGEIAQMFNCSYQKIAALSKAMKKRGDIKRVVHIPGAIARKPDVG